MTSTPLPADPFLNGIYAALYGVVGDGTSDNTEALNRAIAQALASPGLDLILPGGDIRYSTSLAFPDQACALRIRGLGRPKGFLKGVNGDPVAGFGTQLTYTGEGDALGWTLSGSNKRVYLTLENLTIQGNARAKSGHGIHLKAAGPTLGFLVAYRDVTVFGCKDCGILHNGNVFESQLFNVRSTGNGDRGFKSAWNNGGIPGETRIFASTFNVNQVGMELAGGGHWSFHGLTCSNNRNEGLIAHGVQLEGMDLQLEINGSEAGAQASFVLNNALLCGVAINAVKGGRGAGIRFAGSHACKLMNFESNSSVTGDGYRDVILDDGSTTCTLENYSTDDGRSRVDLGSGGGHAFHNGQDWRSAQRRNQAAITVAEGADLRINARIFNSFALNVAKRELSIPAPTVDTALMSGTEIEFIIHNKGSRSLTVNWAKTYLLANGWSDLAVGKRRVVSFVLDPFDLRWVEKARSAADL